MGEVKMVKVVSAAAAGVVFIVAAAGSRVVDEDEQQPRFYDEAAFSEYESDGEEWGNYNAIPDLYNEEQRLVTVQRNSNRRKKTGQSNVQEMANNPFDDPFFNEFVRKSRNKSRYNNPQKIKPPDHQRLQLLLLQLRSKRLRSQNHRRNLRKRSSNRGNQSRRRRKSKSKMN